MEHPSKFNVGVVLETTVRERDYEYIYRLILATVDCNYHPPCKQRVHRRLWLERKYIDRLGNPAWSSIYDDNERYRAQDHLITLLMQKFVLKEPVDWFTVKQFEIASR